MRTHTHTHTPQWNACSLVAKLHLTLCDLMDDSLARSSVHGISQATILEWVAVSFSRENFSAQGSSLHLLHWQADSLPLYHWVTRSPQWNTVAVVQWLSHVWLFSSPGTAAHQAPVSSNISRVCSKSCALSQWWYLTISSSAALSSFCLQSFPASGSFPMSQLLHQVTKALECQLQHQSFQWIFRIDFL